MRSFALLLVLPGLALAAQDNPATFRTKVRKSGRPGRSPIMADSLQLSVPMRPQTLVLLLALCAGPALSQNSSFDLESVVIEGSQIPQSQIVEIAGLRIASPIDKAGIERACRSLQESGLFASISYRYAPGPKKGYVLTLILADQPLQAATIDVPGLDESEAWQWLASRFHRFDHQVPADDSAQSYLARQLERHLGGSLRGQSLTVRMETDLRTLKSTFSFQPEILPRLQSVNFTGNQAITSTELTSVLSHVSANEQYTDRKFAQAVELNLRPVYEQHGLYRVHFVPGGSQWTDAGVSVNLAITEGEPYRLGKAELTGENLPVDAMLSAGKLPIGKLANWRDIQAGIQAMEKAVKRTGFFDAVAQPDRTLDDAEHVLDLRIRVVRGPLYHFGELRITGLTPEQEARARKTWQPKPGDPYDYAYANDFFQAFSRIVDFRSFRKFNAVVQKGNGDRAMDINLVFEAR
jgi:outer membrane protein assembly factor BamA